MEPTKEKIDPQKDELRTSPVAVIGWVIIFLSPLVMACGYKNGVINEVFWAGVAMILPGIACILIGKQKQKK